MTDCKIDAAVFTALSLLILADIVGVIRGGNPLIIQLLQLFIATGMAFLMWRYRQRK